MWGPRVALVVAFAVGLILGVGATLGLRRLSESGGAATDSRAEQASRLIAETTAGVTVRSVSLFAAGAFADFGIELGTRRVNVRIVRRLDLGIEIRAATDVAFGTPPRLCVVGPDSAPDDAGLEDPCWGQPDLSDFLASRLSIDGYGHPLLRAAEPIQFNATLWRSSTRCDYPPGEWTLLLSGDVVVDGHHTGPASARQAAFNVAIPDPAEPLRLVDPEDTRYCGLATRVYNEQGEPALQSPRP